MKTGLLLNRSYRIGTVAARVFSKERVGGGQVDDILRVALDPAGSEPGTKFDIVPAHLDLDGREDEIHDVDIEGAELLVQADLAMEPERAWGAVCLEPAGQGVEQLVGRVRGVALDVERALAVAIAETREVLAQLVEKTHKLVLGSGVHVQALDRDLLGHRVIDESVSHEETGGQAPDLPLEARPAIETGKD